MVEPQNQPPQENPEDMPWEVFVADRLYHGELEEVLGEERYRVFQFFLRDEVIELNHDVFGIRMTVSPDEEPWYMWLIYRVSKVEGEDVTFEPEGLCIPTDETLEARFSTPDGLVGKPFFPLIMEEPPKD